MILNITCNFFLDLPPSFCAVHQNDNKKFICEPLLKLYSGGTLGIIIIF